MIHAAIRWDMRLTDRAVLMHLAGLNEPANQTALAQTLNCGVATIQRSIKRLAACGYVTPVGYGRRIPYTYSVNVDQLPDDIKAELFR